MSFSTFGADSDDVCARLAQLVGSIPGLVTVDKMPLSGESTRYTAA